jgi:hypothetical protein
MQPELTVPVPCALTNFLNADSNSLRFMGSYQLSAISRQLQPLVCSDPNIPEHVMIAALLADG